MAFHKHPTADVSDRAVIGDKTIIWNNAHVREDAKIGSNCIIGDGVYVGRGVTIGDKVKIQNYSVIYRGVTVEDGVLIGPHTCFSNDKYPRALNDDGLLKTDEEWHALKTIVKRGASIGANCTILPGIVIGEYAMIGAGSVVTKDIPPFSLAFGNPAQVKGRVNTCGKIMQEI
jgi:acetyltransferase-like isoleucine patch superfamily enzyme